MAARAPFVTESAAAEPLHWKQRRIGALVVVSEAPRTWAPEELSLLSTVAHQGAAAVESARTALRGLLAQEIHHRVKNNLQTVASLLRLQLGSAGGPAAEKALRESVNRICSIAEVHDLLTSSRVDGVDCAGLIGRLQAMLGQRPRRPPRACRARAGAAARRPGDGACARLLRALLKRGRARRRPDRGRALQGRRPGSCSP